MNNEPFFAKATVGAETVTVTEDRLDGNDRVLSVEGRQYKHQVRLLSFYTPTVTIGTESVAIWGGTRIAVVNPSEHSLCQQDLATGIVAVFSSHEHFIVVCELEAILLNQKCKLLRSLLTTDEVIVNAQIANGRLSITDLRGRTTSSEITPQKH